VIRITLPQSLVLGSSLAFSTPYEPAGPLVTWAARTEQTMRAEIQAAADDISKSLALLRRHL
jgi:hypothetical protein